MQAVTELHRRKSRTVLALIATLLSLPLALLALWLLVILVAATLSGLRYDGPPDIRTLLFTLYCIVAALLPLAGLTCFAAVLFAGDAARTPGWQRLQWYAFSLAVIWAVPFAWLTGRALSSGEGGPFLALFAWCAAILLIAHKLDFTGLQAPDPGDSYPEGTRLD